MNKASNLYNMRFGKLTVISFSEMKRHLPYWNCLCDCGNEITTNRYRLLSGMTKSCGCIKLMGNSATHRESSSAEYHSWSGIKSRCLNEKNPCYYRYGGRGITVCDEWIDSFENFLRDMGKKPSPKHSVERRDNNKGYSLENCYWATPKEQSNNKRNNVMITYKGKTQNITQWAEELNLPFKLIHKRLRILGWSTERAFIR